MYLKSLTVKGFKSFAQSTTFQFEPGVTAIVGPNGSGKSNVVDALAWVMGEQGAKTLRGGKMEDVIFAGTSTRGPLGRAEVRLTIDNSDGALPIEYSEVTISRTLFRSGSSEYAINGEACRLLDVQELLSDSGLGREMHVIVGQGQLDAVLRATPEDRRGFIEEAAGILKHRRRKERTERKLEAMETNLTRLSDLAGEIRRQLKPLGRQAEVAKQAQEIAAEVRELRARLLAHDVAKLRVELHELSQSEAERHSERIVLQEQLEQKKLRIARLESDQQSDELDHARRVTLALESAHSRLSGVADAARRRLVFLETQQESPEHTGRLNQSAVDEAAREAESLSELIVEVERAWVDATELTAQAQAALDGYDEHLAAQSALVSQHDLEISQLRGRLEAAQKALEAVNQEAMRRAQAVEQARERARVAHAEFEAAVAEFDEGGFADVNPHDEYRLAQERQAAAEQARDAVRDRLHSLEREQAGCEARLSALSAALDDRDASGSLLAGDPPGIRGRVSEHVQVDAGFEAAVGAALGRFADALLAQSAEHAASALASAHRDDLGRVGIVVAGDAEFDRAQAGPKVASAVRAVDVVRAPVGVLSLLARSYIASDVSAAQSALDELRGELSTSSFTVVTRAGDVLTHFTLEGGSSLAPSRIELTADRDQTSEQLARITAQTSELAVELAELNSQAAQAKTQTEEAFATLRAIDAQLAAAAEQRNRLSARAEAAAGEAERAEHARDAVAAKVREAEEEAARAAQVLSAAEERPRPMFDASEREGLAAELDAAREVELERRLALETARERARAAHGQHRLFVEQLEAERVAAEEAARRAALRQRQIAQAELVISLLPQVQAICDASVAEARIEQQTREATRARHSQELTLLRSEEAELRERLQALTEQVHGAELKSYERKLQLSALLERAGSELGLVEEVLLAEYGSATNAASASGDDAAPVPFDRNATEQQLRKTERRLGELGRINPLALEEFAALEQRHQFLTEQLADLTKTRSDLLTIIGELDDKMQGIFADAFADTQAAFAEVFPLLFPGGSGDIALTDPNNLLATGIEMTVKPAGKKVERLSLLSGGERSLAAVAWLVAIFRARPSPFYIMDEVEAALDDANLGRLLQVFESLRENSQLIVITHQKRTMEIADALYGVSMRQDGISVVVGQRIREQQDALST